MCLYKCCCCLVSRCATLLDPMDCSLPGSSVHGISQARIWSGLLFPTLGDLPNPGIEPGSPALQWVIYVLQMFILSLCQEPKLIQNGRNKWKSRKSNNQYILAILQTANNKLIVQSVIL